MSVAYYIIPERAIDGFDPFVNGKALGHADEKALANLCQQLNVIPLTDFLSEDPDEVEEFFADEDLEIAETPPAVEWFEASAGLNTVRALLQHLAAQPESLNHAATVVADLQEYEDVLTRLEQEKVRWRLALDF